MSKTIDIIARAMAAKGGQSKNVSDIEVDGRSIVKPDGTAELATESPYDPDTNPLATMNDVGGGSVDSLIEEVTWSQLKTKRDAGELTPGMKYRITDYNCTTSQPDTQSAGHQFDIIVTALTNKELSEDALADYHSGDNYFQGAGSADFIEDLDIESVETIVQILHGRESSYHKDRGFTDYGKDNNGDLWIAYDGGDFFDKYIYQGRADYEGETYDLWKCNVEPNNEKLSYTNIITETVMVKRANLSAWQLKYCLDNDANRFAWAQPGDDLKAIKVKSVDDNTTYIYKRYPERDYTESTPKGPLYWQAWIFVIGSDDIVDFDDPSLDYSKIDTDDVIWYTGYRAGEGLDRDGDYIYLAMRNPTPAGKGVIYYMKDEWSNECPYDFKNIMFKRYTCNNNGSIVSNFDADYYGTKSSRGREWQVYPFNYTLDLSDYVWFYTFSGTVDGDKAQSYDMSIPHKVSEATIEYIESDGGGHDTLDSCYNNKILPSHLEYMEDDDYNKGRILLNNIVMLGTFYDDEGQGDYPETGNCHNNVFEPDCADITLDRDCADNRFCAGCCGITSSSSFENNYIGALSYLINFSYSCHHNNFAARITSSEFSNMNAYNTLKGDNQTIKFSAGCSYNTLGRNTSSVTFGMSCLRNILGDYCGLTTFGNYCNDNVIGQNCYGNKFGTSNSVTSYCQYNIIDSGVGSVWLTANNTRQGQYLQYVHIHSGISTTSIVVPVVGQNYTIDYYANNSEDRYI